MKYDVELIVSKGGTGITAYLQYLDSIDMVTQKFLTNFNAPNWNCAETQLLLDTIQEQGGLTVTLFDEFNVEIGTVNLLINSDTSAECGGAEEATIGYDVNIPNINRTYYFRWELGTATTYDVLELYDNEVISQNWRFSDLQTFAALGSFSRQFRIPATRNNLEALGYLTDVNFKPDIDYFQTKLPAELRVQTLPIAIGYIRVMRVITQADVLSDFELTFYAESPDLFNAIAGKKLKDIEALQDLNAILDYDEVINATGYPYLYSLSDYGQKWDQSGTTGTRSIYSTPVFQAPRAGDLTPSLSWKWIFEKIITEAGFTYEGLELDNILYRYYAPWINSKQLKYTQNVQSFIFRFWHNANTVLTPTPVAVTNVTEDFDNGNTVTSAVFTAPATALYTFRYWYTFTSGGFFGGSVNVYFNNITTGAMIMLGTSQITGFTENFDSVNGAPQFFLSAGDQFRLMYQATTSATLIGGSDYTTGTGLELIDANFMDGLELDWAANAPDVTQADFLRDVLNMHCCVLVPDRAIPNKIILEPIDTYIGSGDDRDWTEKLDISKDITLTNTSDFQNKRLTFTYSAGEDVGSKIYTALNRIYGDYKLENYTVSVNDVPNDFARDGEQKVQLVTQSTPANYIKGTSLVIPKFVDDAGNFVSPKLRCLFYAADYEMTLFDFGTGTADTSYVVPVLNHYEFVYPFFNSLDLNWAPEVPLHIIGPVPYKTLFNVYWRDYLNQLYSPQARIMDAYFALDLSDILGFKFSDRIWVKNSWWRILEINDYKVGSAEVTQVKLLKLIDAVPEAADSPSAIDENGVVQFVDGNGDPVSSTQQTCERYGYFWDPVTETCYGFTTTPQNITTAATTKVGRSLSEVQNADNTIVMTTKLNNATTNDYTLAVGSDITISDGNSKSIAVGEQLQMEGTGGVSMFGRNVYTKQSGQHLGGGYMVNTIDTSPVGYAQSGVIILQAKQTFASTGGQYITINGVPNAHIEMPDDTCWNCMLSYTIQDNNLTGNYESGLISFAMTKTGGVAQVSALTPLNVIGAIGAYTFSFEVNIGVTSLHRIGYKVMGSPFPETFHVIASLTYTQSKLT